MALNAHYSFHNEMGPLNAFNNFHNDMASSTTKNIQKEIYLSTLKNLHNWDGSKCSL